MLICWNIIDALMTTLIHIDILSCQFKAKIINMHYIIDAFDRDVSIYDDNFKSSIFIHHNTYLFKVATQYSNMPSMRNWKINLKFFLLCWHDNKWIFLYRKNCFLIECWRAKLAKHDLLLWRLVICNNMENQYKKTQKLCILRYRVHSFP